MSKEINNAMKLVLGAINPGKVEEIVDELVNEFKEVNDLNAVIEGEYEFGNTFIGKLYTKFELVSAVLFAKDITLSYSIIKIKEDDADSEIPDSLRKFTFRVKYVMLNQS